MGVRQLQAGVKVCLCPILMNAHTHTHVAFAIDHSLAGRNDIPEFYTARMCSLWQKSGIVVDMAALIVTCVGCIIIGASIEFRMEIASHLRLEKEGSYARANLVSGERRNVIMNRPARSTGETDFQPACAVDVVHPGGVRGSLDVTTTSNTTTISGREFQEFFGLDLQDFNQNSGNLEALENRRTIDHEGVTRFGQLQPCGTGYSPAPALMLSSSTFLQLPSQTVHPKRMMFLCNFTTSKGIASIFNFAFSNSRHKSRKSIVQYQKPSRELGNQFKASSLQCHLTTTFQDSLSLHVEINKGSENLADLQECSVNSNLESGYSGLTSLMDNSRPGSCLDPNLTFASTDNSINVLNWVTDPLFLKTREILVNFQKIAAQPSFGTATPLLVAPAPQISSIYNSRCLRFFSPPNLRKFINIFWDDWYPHCPIIHRPSFDLAEAPATLVVAMALIGSALSPHTTDLEMAREWFQPAEQIAFKDSQDYWKGELSEKESWVSREIKPSGLQAALLICCLQNWEGDTEAKTRIRRYRYRDLVDMARETRLERATHDGGSLWSSQNFKWAQYIAIEELIRTLTFIFLVDSSFVIFNNSPPKMHLQELVFDLISPTACFEAETAEECLCSLRRLCSPGSLRATLSFAKTVEILRLNTFDEKTCSMFLQLDSLNLFSILSALHEWVFQQERSILTLSGLETWIRNSLETWKLVWDARSDLSFIRALEGESSIQLWKRIGFFQHADEYRQFVMHILELLHQPPVGLALQAKRPEMVTPFLKYDETSMDQVAEALHSF
ncbi:hypothetical protein BGZ60DRAFT_533594 [Tricladium varicosporioides]|nr:hypothetical protein BGZ60DRAFT_533594 [Hymenoscyphus varicosporioides]